MNYIVRKSVYSDPSFDRLGSRWPILPPEPAFKYGTVIFVCVLLKSDVLVAAEQGKHTVCTKVCLVRMLEN